MSESGRIVIACYKPKPGKEKKLTELMKTHVEILRMEGLATFRPPIIMKAKSRTIIEVFEWKSIDAIQIAHSNRAIQQMWEKYSEVCTYQITVNIEEFYNLFSEFES
ncbi:hypothetical protein ACFLSA_02155 [Bacteroidota bacterium]